MVSDRLHRVSAAIACFAVLLAGGCAAPGPSAGPAVRDASSRAVQSAVQHPAVGEPAPDFNFYIFSLSWSPEYCHGHPNSAQCDGSHPGFVVHGLWPQRNDGQWPSSCSNAPGLSDPNSMLDMMPSRRLIAHEWEKHGTCTGLSPQQYFGNIRRAYTYRRAWSTHASLAGPARAPSSRCSLRSTAA
jgi:ribonuclease T2